MSKLAPALLSGSTIVIKPSPETPLDVVEAVVGDGAAEAKRELRRQRRKSRPHGRAR